MEVRMSILNVLISALIFIQRAYEIISPYHPKMHPRGPDRLHLPRRTWLDPLRALAVWRLAHRQTKNVLDVSDPAGFWNEPVALLDPILDLFVGCHEMSALSHLS